MLMIFAFAITPFEDLLTRYWSRFETRFRHLYLSPYHARRPRAQSAPPAEKVERRQRVKARSRIVTIYQSPQQFMHYYTVDLRDIDAAASGKR